MVEIAGIYMIRNVVNGRVYIGSSKELRRRLYLHKYDLKKNVHHSITLQRAWNKYGPDCFEFLVLFQCAESDLEYFEQRSMDVYKSAVPARGYNIRSFVDIRMVNLVNNRWTPEQRAKHSASRTGRSIFKSNPEAMANLLAAVHRGESHHMYGKKHTEETIKKMSAIKKGKPAWNKGVPSDRKGISRSPEVIQKMRDSKRASSPQFRKVLPFKEYIIAQYQSGRKIVDLMREFEVDRTVICSILNEAGIIKWRQKM